MMIYAFVIYLIIGCGWWLLVATGQCVAESKPAMGIPGNGQQRTSAREKQMNHQTAHLIFLSATYILFFTKLHNIIHQPQRIHALSSRYPPAQCATAEGHKSGRRGHKKAVTPAYRKSPF